MQPCPLAKLGSANAGADFKSFVSRVIAEGKGNKFLNLGVAFTLAGVRGKAPYLFLVVELNQFFLAYLNIHIYY